PADRTLRDGRLVVRERWVHPLRWPRQQGHPPPRERRRRVVLQHRPGPPPVGLQPARLRRRHHLGDRHLPLGPALVPLRGAVLVLSRCAPVFGVRCSVFGRWRGLTRRNPKSRSTPTRCGWRTGRQPSGRTPKTEHRTPERPKGATGKTARVLPGSTSRSSPNG